MPDLPEVREGDVWKDNDPRGGPIFVVGRVCLEEMHELFGGGAVVPDGHCGAMRAGRLVREPHAHVTDTDGRRIRTVLLKRFKATGRGYVLVSRDGVPTGNFKPKEI